MVKRLHGIVGAGIGLIGLGLLLIIPGYLNETDQGIIQGGMVILILGIGVAIVGVIYSYKGR